MTYWGRDINRDQTSIPVFPIRYAFLLHEKVLYYQG